MLSTVEYTMADTILNILLHSDKYQNKNILFIEPFDINEVPDYLQVIGPPIDIRTIANRFYNTGSSNNSSSSVSSPNNYYTNMTDFWNDIYRVYNNAIQYHSNKPASKWIAKFAKDMIKIVNKERKNMEAKVQLGTGGTMMLHPSNQKNQIIGAPTPEFAMSGMNSSSSSSNHSSSNHNSSYNHKNNNHHDSSHPTSTSSFDTAPSKPKTKLKLQLPTNKSSSSTAAVVTSSGTGVIPMDTNNNNETESPVKKQFKLKLKLSKSSSTTTTTSNNNNSDPPLDSSTNPPKKKGGTSSTQTAKLKLKLSLSNKNNSTVGSSNVDHTTLLTDPDQPMEDGEILAPVITSSSNNNNNAATASTQKIKATTPRGKELPQGVMMPVVPTTNIIGSTNTASSNTNNNTTSAVVPNVKKVTTSKKTKKLPMSTTNASNVNNNNSNNNMDAFVVPSSNISNISNSGGSGLDPYQSKQCYKVLYGLKRRKTKQIYWFLSPVSDKNILLDYKSKIKYPMDLSTVQSKLEKGMYKKLEAFVFDVRRIFANALRYNTSIKDSLRPLAVEGLQCTEQLFVMFLARNCGVSSSGTNSNNNNNNNNNNHSNNSTSTTPYIPLLYCWNVCINILDTLYNLVNPIDGQPMAYYFLHPVSVYCGGKFPPDYLELVKKPMDFGTITANLIEGRYQTTEAFANDCRLVVQNCQTYYQGKEESRVFLDQAMRLNECLSTQVSQLARYDKSMKGESERRKLQQLITNPTRITHELILPNQPPMAIYLGILEELRSMKYTDKGTKITEPAMSPFEKPVSLSDYPDYAQYISEPIDLQTIERKVKSNEYETPEDFEYDMNLMFKNCEVYNSRRNAQHPVAMSKFAQRKFRGMFYTKIQAYEDPASVIAEPQAVLSSSSSLAATEETTIGPSPNKKIKIDLNASSSKGKTAPKISISASSGNVVGRAKSPANIPQSTSTSLTAPSRPPAPVVTKPKVDAPVPLHIAIAKVKEAFPIRRAVKSLQVWEADCARYYKELMRHPWISAARPKFVFSCPVPILFPELSEHYAAKIRHPMDLTTIECTLLAGNRYAGPEDFIQDIALVFANAIRFNKDGKDVGDPLSCAYYDASVHLLKYSRWLSLDLLSTYVEESDHMDEPTSDGLPPFSWKLTTGNRLLARKEVEDFVLNEPIEKSLEGDRYSWMEAECEKLLKALRHQSDLRYMSFFIQPNYPVDYTAFISKPMDWERVQRTLKKRHYDTIGALISDLRLIFTNAEKYNSRLKGTDTVSGLAYEAADIMSKKLEVAINKLLLTVSDRLERERIDHVNAEREIEAAERAEEAEIRAAWNKQEQPLDKNGTAGGLPSSVLPSASSMRSDMSQKTRIVRRLPQRTNFEVPFFDEGDSDRYRLSNNNTRSVGDNDAVKVQKALFEKQRYELTKMRAASASIGAAVFLRLLERQVMDHEELQRQQVALDSNHGEITANKDHDGLLTDTNAKVSDDNDNRNSATSASRQPSSVLDALEKEGRGPLQIKFLSAKKKSNKKKRPTPSIPEGF